MAHKEMGGGGVEGAGDWGMGKFYLPTKMHYIERTNHANVMGISLLD